MLKLLVKHLVYFPLFVLLFIFYLFFDFSNFPMPHHLSQYTYMDFVLLVGKVKFP